MFSWFTVIFYPQINKLGALWTVSCGYFSSTEVSALSDDRSRMACERRVARNEGASVFPGR